MEFQRFGFKANFKLAKLDAAVIANFAEWDGDQGHCGKAGFTKAQWEDENSRLWGILSDSMKDHPTCASLVDSHLGNYAKAMSSVHLWAVGNLDDTKSGLRDEIDELFDEARDLSSMQGNIAKINTNLGRSGADRFYDIIAKA